MESVESSLEQRPRATHDYRDIGGRVTPGAVTEDAKSEVNFLWDQISSEICDTL